MESALTHLERAELFRDKAVQKAEIDLQEAGLWADLAGLSVDIARVIQDFRLPFNYDRMRRLTQDDVELAQER